MGRVATLKPKYNKERRRWCLSVPPELSSSGKRERLFFKTEPEADKHANLLKKTVKRFNITNPSMTPELIRDALQSNELALEYGYRGLRHLVDEHIKSLDKSAAAPPFADVLDAFYADHSGNWGEDYVQHRWKPFRARLSDMETVSLALLDEERWREWLTTWSDEAKPAASTYNQQLGMIRSVMEHGKAAKHQPINPLKALPQRKEGITEVPVHTPDEAKRLLYTAVEHDIDLVPYYAICYFAGLRPDSEAVALHFQHIDWEAKHIRVTVTKTAGSTGINKRFVELSDALMAWLEPWRHAKGSIIPAKNFRRRREGLIQGYHTTPGATWRNREKWTELVPWAYDITRHSYGSYFEAAHRSETGVRERLAANMGHTSYKTFEAHYRNARTPQEAKAFWAIRPPKSQVWQVAKFLKVA